jgi:GTP-binding protein
VERSDEDPTGSAPERALKIESAEFLRSVVEPTGLLAGDEPEVAFAGRSNVGKSTLLNALVGRKIARTSNTPGRTQAVNYFRVNGRWLFVDLPGFGYARASKEARRQWAEIIGEYLARPHARRMVVQLVDARVGATVLDEQAGEFFESLDLPRLVVATKIDDVKRGARARQLQEISRALRLESPAAIVAVSAQSGEGIRELWKSITEFLAG